MCTWRKYRIIVLVVVLCISIPLVGTASIEPERTTEPSTESGFPLMESLPGVPPYPGMEQSMQGDMVPSFSQIPASEMYNPAYPGYYDGAQGYGTMMSPGTMSPYPPTGMAPEQYPQGYTPYPYELSPNYQPPYQGQGQWYPQYPQYPQTPGYPYPPQPPYGSADQAYNQAMQAYRNHDYWTAMNQFQQVAMRYSQSDLADNAYYWMGEIHYAWRNFSGAIQSFQTVLHAYPRGNKVPDAYLKMGYAYAEIRQYNTAKAILNEVVSRYSDNSRIRNLALKKLNELNNVF